MRTGHSGHGIFRFTIPIIISSEGMGVCRQLILTLRTTQDRLRREENCGVAPFGRLVMDNKPAVALSTHPL